MPREIIPPPPRDDTSADFRADLAAARARGPDAMLIEEIRLAAENPNWSDAQVSFEASRIVQYRNQRRWYNPFSW